MLPLRCRRLSGSLQAAARSRPRRSDQMMRTSFRLLLLGLLGMSAVALADMHTFRIQRSGRDTAIQFDAYHLGKNYKARLVSLEASGASATKLSAVATPQRPLVVAETFGAGRS